MKIHIATLFPEMCQAVLSESIIGRAVSAGKIEIFCHQIRDYSTDKHRRADDSPYGGGMGMVMTAEPIYQCFTQVTADLSDKPHVIYMSPKGVVLTQKKAVELSKMPQLFIICGHYEGVDQRLIDEIVDEEISVGDYVLTGGELPALVLVDTVARLCNGVLPSAECYEEESHFNGLLEHPHYTRPEVWHGLAAPDVLLSGHHKNIVEYRERESFRITKEKRPDLLK